MYALSYDMQVKPRPSEGKPWLKYFSPEAVAAPLPQDTLYGYLVAQNGAYPDNAALNYYGNRIPFGRALREIDVDGKPFRGALVEHLRTGVRTCYEVDEQTTYWTLWNNGGQVPYCCPEPQTWTTNAPNAADPAAEGFRAIDPGESWRTTFRLYAK